MYKPAEKMLFHLKKWHFPKIHSSLIYQRYSKPSRSLLWLNFTWNTVCSTTVSNATQPLDSECCIWWFPAAGIFPMELRCASKQLDRCVYTRNTCKMHQYNILLLLLPHTLVQHRWSWKISCLATFDKSTKASNKVQFNCSFDNNCV